MKGESLFHSSKSMDLRVNGEPLDLDPGQTLIYYVDEKAPEFSMQGLTAGIIAVIVVVSLAVIAGIVVLVSTGMSQGSGKDGFLYWPEKLPVFGIFSEGLYCVSGSSLQNSHFLKLEKIDRS